MLHAPSRQRRSNGTTGGFLCIPSRLCPILGKPLGGRLQPSPAEPEIQARVLDFPTAVRGLIPSDPSELYPPKCPSGFCLHVSPEIRGIHRTIERQFRGLTGIVAKSMLWVEYFTHVCPCSLAHMRSVTHTQRCTYPHKYLYSNTHTLMCS